MVCQTVEGRLFGQFLLERARNEKKEKGEKEKGMSSHSFATDSTLVLNLQCKSPIEAHQIPASCLLSSSEPQAPGERAGGHK